VKLRPACINHSMVERCQLLAVADALGDLAGLGLRS
jgi:hypothetical protein